MMRWLSRHKRSIPRTLRTRPFDEEALPEQLKPTREAGVSEGMLLAEYATRMAVKNQIVIDAFESQERYQPEHYTQEAAHLFQELAAEQGGIAGRIDVELSDAGRLRGDAQHPHDYRSADVENLRLRREVAGELAHTLRTRADDPVSVRELVESSREDAWHEVARAIEAGLDAFTGVEGLRADYERERSARLKIFLRHDLGRLIEDHSGY